MDRGEIIREVLATWADGPDAAKASWRKHAAENIVWWNNARGQVEGLEQCLEAIDAMYDLLKVDHTKVPVKNLVTVDGRVWVERSDDLYRADGSLIRAVPVVGIIEFDDADKITVWRDYADDWMLKLEHPEIDR